jgi:hypothetical protein
VPNTALLDLMWHASRERFGLVVETTSPERLRQLLYGIRRREADFADIKLSVADGKLWILNREGTLLQEREAHAETLREPDPS